MGKETLTDAQREMLTDEEIEGYEEVLAEEGEDPDAPASTPDPAGDATEADAKAEAERATAEAEAKREAEAKDKAEAEAAEKVKAEADAQAEKEAKASQEKTNEAVNNEPEKEQDPEKQEELARPAPQPSSSFPTFEKPAGAEDRIKAINTGLNEIADRFDEGEITAREFREESQRLEDERRDLERQIDRHEFSVAVQQQDTENKAAAFAESVASFLSQHPEYAEGSEDYFLLDSMVRQIQATSGDQYDPTHITKAHEKLQAKLGGQSDPPKTETKGEREEPRPPSPPTLGNVPSAGIEATEDGRFAAIDRLEGEDQEAAYSQMTPQQQEEYLARD